MLQTIDCKQRGKSTPTSFISSHTRCTHLHMSGCSTKGCSASCLMPLSMASRISAVDHTLSCKWRAVFQLLPHRMLSEHKTERRTGIQYGERERERTGVEINLFAALLHRELPKKTPNLQATEHAQDIVVNLGHPRERFQLAREDEGGRRSSGGNTPRHTCDMGDGSWAME